MTQVMLKPLDSGAQCTKFLIAEDADAYDIRPARRSLRTQGTAESASDSERVAESRPIRERDFDGIRVPRRTVVLRCG